MSEIFAVRGRLALDGGLHEGAVIVRDGRIIEVTRRAASGNLPPTVYDAPIVAPGFIDLQVNGGFGCDIGADPRAFRTLAAKLPSTGVTAFLPTLISSRAEVYPSVIAALREGRNATGAAMLGVHLEGPFLAPARKGAHPLDAIEGATADLFGLLLDQPELRLMTLAPERPGARERIEALRRRGVLVSLGHTDATAEEFAAGVDAGATMATHLFNAMSPFGHRAPGAIGAALVDDRVTVGLIVDGVHAHPDAIRLAVKAKGPDRIALVTDMMAAAGMPPGTYQLGGNDVVTDGIAARLPDGTLAGAVLLMPDAIRNVSEWTGIGLGAAIRLATEIPARLLGDPDRGRLVVGSRADLVLLSSDVSVMGTFVGGQRVYDGSVGPSHGK